MIKNMSNNSNLYKFNEIQQQILTRIKPTPETKDILKKTIKNLINRVNKIIKDQKLTFQIEPILVGSTAKDTHLENPDIDLFIMFPNTVAVEELRRLGLFLGHNVLPDGEERYAEHPYVSGKFNGFDTDIVPCYKLDKIEDRMTAVDRTPFHSQYIIKHLHPDQHDEVRLLKQFMKGVGVYGAEIEVQGFSGYLCELLILKYGNILNLFGYALTWPDELVLSLEEEDIKIESKAGYKLKSELPIRLALKFKDEPLVFIDPIDKIRNVASAVEVNKLRLFKSAIKSYLKKPKTEFYFPNPVKPLSLPEIKEEFEPRFERIIGVKFPTPKIIPDILYGQLRKGQRSIFKSLTKAGFVVEFSEFYVNDLTIILFELKESKLSDIEIHSGPPEGHKNANDFLTKWRTSSNALNKPYLKDHRWYVDINRKFTTPDKLIIGKIDELNLGKLINSEIKKAINIYKGNELLKPGFEKALTLFLERKYPWEY